MNKVFKAHLFILAANLIYGANYTIAKGIMPDYAHPLGLAVCRSIGAVVLFWLISLSIAKEKVDRRDFRIMFFSALFGVVFNQLLFLLGLNYTTEINAAIIMTINPIVVLVVAAIILKERITSRKIAGITLGAIGAITLTLFTGSISLKSETFLGNMMQLMNASSYAVYLVIVKPLMKKYHPYTVMRWVFLFGSFFIIPIGFSHFIEIDWQNMPLQIIASVFYLVVFTTFFAYLLNIKGLKDVNPVVVSIYIYLQPLFASLIAIILQKDDLNLVKIISMILVFAGVYLVSFKRNYWKTYRQNQKLTN